MSARRDLASPGQNATPVELWKRPMGRFFARKSSAFSEKERQNRAFMLE